MIYCSRLSKYFPFIFLVSVLSTHLSFAAELAPKTYTSEPTRIRFQVDAQEKVAGDQMQATLRLETKNRQPAIAAKELNQRLQETMRQLREDKTLRVETNQYMTQQLYDEKGKAKDWQVSVELTLSSDQWNRLSEHIGALQNKGWLFSGVNFEVSQEQRKAAEKRLTLRALAEWKERAELVAKQLQLKTWRLGTLEISHQGIQPHPPIFQPRLAMMATASAAPDMAGTDTTLNVTVSGELVSE